MEYAIYAWIRYPLKNSKNSDNGRDSQCNAGKFFEKSDTSRLPLFQAQVKYEKNNILKFLFFFMYSLDLNLHFVHITLA